MKCIVFCQYPAWAAFQTPNFGIKDLRKYPEIKEHFYGLLVKCVIALTKHNKIWLAKCGMLISDRCKVTLKRFLRELLLYFGVTKKK